MDGFTHQLVAILFLSLRIAPAFAYGQPFTLIRVPMLVRLLLSIGLAMGLVGTVPAAAASIDLRAGPLIQYAASELMLGMLLALALQLAFAAILTAGRVIDIQSGYGLAILVDPATRTQMPLIGTVLAYLGGVLFFASEGPRQLLAILALSIERVPIGSASLVDPAPIVAYLSALFLLALGLVGVVMLVLFVLDIAVAYMSRTLPQMNVLLFGFQVKAIAAIAVLPVAVALSASIYLKLFRLALDMTVAIF